MTFEAIVKDLNARKFSPIYFLDGDEPYFIDDVLHFLENEVLNESERSFNQTILYGKDTDVPTIIAEAKRYPMMAPYQVVIIKEAQYLKDIDDLIAYAENPQPTTILAIGYKGKTLDKRKKFGKLISKNFVHATSKKLYENQIQSWVETHLRKMGFKVSPKASVLLAQSVGADLSRLNNEINKLKLVVKPGGDITAQVIEENIGISKDYNNFELTKAIGVKDVLKCNTIAKHFSKDPNHNHIVASIGVIFSFFNKIMIYHALPDKSQKSVASALRVNPFFVGEYFTAASNYPLSKCRAVVSYLRDYDMRSKGVNNSQTSQYDLMRELLYKILH